MEYIVLSRFRRPCTGRHGYVPVTWPRGCVCSFLGDQCSKVLVQRSAHPQRRTMIPEERTSKAFKQLAKRHIVLSNISLFRLWCPLIGTQLEIRKEYENGSLSGKQKIRLPFLCWALRFYYCMFSSTFPAKIKEAMSAIRMDLLLLEYQTVELL